MTSLLSLMGLPLIDRITTAMSNYGTAATAHNSHTLWDETQLVIDYLFEVVATHQSRIHQDGGQYVIPRLINRVNSAFDMIRATPGAHGYDWYLQMAFQVELLQFLKRFGPEVFIMHAIRRQLPSDVRVGPVTRANFVRFADTPELLKSISDAAFEELIADRLSTMGFQVQMVGNTYHKDGGIDIIAWPKREVPFPFLIACQVKHHHTDRNTPVGDVREFFGAISASGNRFNLGIIATNSHFTADAHWFARNNETMLRLRDIDDLCRWLKGDFVGEANWREIPDRVEVAPGVIVEIPKPELWLPEEK